MSVRVAIVGCGGVSRSHIAGLKKLPDAEIVAMCDLVEEKAASHAKEHGGTPYTDLGEMLKAEKPDVCDVCTREMDHCEPTVQCLQAGVPAMVEKPMHADINQYNVRPSDVPKAQQMVRAAMDNNVLLRMAYNYRYSPYALMLREMIASGELGEPVYVDANCHLACWSHTIDLIRFFNGDVVEMGARMAGPENEQTRAATFRFANDSVGTLIGQTQTGWQHDLLRIEYVGSKGKAVMRDIAGGLYLYPRDRREEIIHKTPHDGPRSEFQLTFDGQMAALIEQVGKGTPTHGATGLDGLRELEIDAGYVVASESGSWLNLREHWGGP
jgi:predicted dehydrogenase